MVVVVVDVDVAKDSQADVVTRKVSLENARVNGALNLDLHGGKNFEKIFLIF